MKNDPEEIKRFNSLSPEALLMVLKSGCRVTILVDAHIYLEPDLDTHYIEVRSEMYGSSGLQTLTVDGVMLAMKDAIELYHEIYD